MRRFLVALALALSVPASASTYTVDDNGDDPDFNPGDDVCSTALIGGVCTLRAAIMEANANAGIDEIAFDTTGIFAPLTEYPAIVETVTIDGRTAPGYASAPLVLIDGSSSGLDVGLHFDTGSDESELIALEISGFAVTAVLVDADELTIRRNWLGPVTQGLSNLDGLQLNGDNSTVGGSDDGGNVISGNDQYGILVTGTNHNIRDNFIGTDDTGAAALANGEDGIAINGATGVTIGGPAGEENVISGNFDVGVSIDDGSGNTVAGNYIGLDVTGAVSIPNFIGVEVFSDGNTIAGNVISGNDDDGIDVLAEATIVQNNLIGTDATGLIGVGNFGFGVAVLFTTNVDIGGLDVDEGNVISFNGAEGVFFLEVDDSRILGNLIGLDVAGTNILGNGLEGILLVDSFDITIGSNSVSGNSAGGIVDGGGIGNLIEDNRVGTTSDGNSDAGNLGTGIELFATLDAIVRSNVVSANAGHGIETTFGSVGALIHSNIIGLGADLTSEMGNFGDGVNVCDGAADTVVGSEALGGNTIRGNGANGIGVEPTALQNNTWAANSIDDHELLGIDIEIDGVTPNDEDDPDEGANNLQNYPDLDAAATSLTTSFVSGTINTLPSTAFTLHFYTSPAADSSGFGEGRTYLGELTGMTDAGGDASFLFTGPALTIGEFVTATATTTDGTSEFSGVEEVEEATAVSFSSSAYSVNEADGTVTITVTRSGNLDLESTVDYDTADDSAIAGSDYTATSGTLTFVAGDDTETFDVPITNDNVDESGEVFSVTLSNPTFAAITAPSFAEVTIDDDDPTPDLFIDDVSLAEGTGGTTNFVFTISLTGASGADVSVTYQTNNGGATAGSDYNAQNDTAVITAGNLSTTITVPVTADNIFEDDETFTVTLSGALNANISDNTGQGTIENDDNLPEISIDNVGEPEGTSIVFTISLTNPSENNVSVNYQTTGITATAGTDYTSQSNLATILPGTTSTTVTVPTTADALLENDETFSVDLSESGGGTIDDGQGIGTIENDDAAPTLTIDDISETEGTDLVFTVTLSAVSGLDVTFDYDTADGTATAGTDYTAQSDSATILAGSTTATITVPSTVDALFENDETFTVELSNPTNAAIADDSGQGTIENDDAMPTLSINDFSDATEDNDTSFTVTLSEAAGVDVTFNYATSDDTATAGSDYTAQSDTATIPAGSTSVGLVVPVNDDTLFEGNEMYFMDISNATNATIVEDHSDATITDNDAMPSITIEDEAIAEGNNLVFTVTLSAAAGVDVTVEYDTADDTATAGSDYTTQSDTATIPAGSTSTTITVPTTEDALFEADETFFVDLSNPANATIGDDQAVGTIQNDEGLPGITIDDVSESEGDNLIFTITLSEAAAVDVTVNYETADDTATAGSDYTAQSDTATITAGNTSTTVTVPSTEDALLENDETFFVNLSGATNAAIDDNQGLGTIEDDDPMPSVTIDDVSETEGTDLVFTLTLSAVAGVDVTVDYETADDTATAGSDYTAQSDTAVIPAGTLTATITVPTAADALFEGDETMFVDLTGATNATIADNQGIGTIEDGDATPSVSIDDVSETEGTDLVFTLTLSAVAGVDVTVDYETADGTATAGSDYTAQSDTAVIAAGTLTTTITVPTAADGTFEPDETLFVNLTGATNATIADDQGTGTIENDDDAPPTTADLSMSKTTPATTFTPGQQITYTLTVQNAGPLAAAGITVTDELPPGTSLVSANSPDAVCSGTTTVTCTIAALANGATATITLVVIATGDDPITNTATVSAAEPADGAPANNSAFAVISPAVLGAGIPTLSEWALLLMAALLAAVALRRT